MRSAKILSARNVSRRTCSSWLWPFTFFPMVTTAFVGFTYVLFVSDYESGLWFEPLGVVVFPLGLLMTGVLSIVATYRLLQVVGVIGVVYVRAFKDGSALVGSRWRVRGGHGLAVERATKVKVKVVETMPKVLGWRHDTGIPVYMAWTVSTAGRKFSWLTPFDAAPDAASRIQAVLADLPEPTFASLASSQAARAGGV